MQAPCFIIASLLAGLAAAGPPQQETTLSDAAARLRADCDLLLQQAVQRPYGWGWAATSDPAGATRQPAPTISLGPLQTPAVGLLLLWAGRQLNESRYQQAAREAAHGIVAVQEASGRVPALALFGKQALGQDPAHQVPDRATTCANLAFLLTMLDEGHGNDEMIRRGAARAARWLMRQQTPNGAWPVGMMYQGEGQDPRPVRLIRLDDPDYRNSTAALLYASQVLSDRMMLTAAQRSTAQLSRLAITQSKTARGLWLAAYELDGTPSSKLPQTAGSVDIAACRYCMQTLALSSVIATDAPASSALQTAASSVAALRYDDSLWLYRYPLSPNNELPAIYRGPAPRSDAIFASTRPSVDSNTDPGTFGLPAVLGLAHELRTSRPSEIRNRICLPFTPRQELARMLVGLTDEPMVREQASRPEPTTMASLPSGKETTAVVQRIARLLTVLRLQQPAQTK